MFVRQFPLPFMLIHISDSTGTSRCSSDTRNVNVFLQWALLLPGRLGCSAGRKSLGLHCVEGAAVKFLGKCFWNPSVPLISSAAGPSRNRTKCLREPRLSSTQHAITTLCTYTEFEALKMTEIPLTEYPERTAVGQPPAFEEYGQSRCLSLGASTASGYQSLGERPLT